MMQRGKKGLIGKRCRKGRKIFIQENVKRGKEGKKMEESWELLEEGKLCNEGRKLCGR